jgi:hypothetical protein
MIWSIPNEKYPNISNIGEIKVKEGQRAVIYNSGVFQTLFPPGTNRVLSEFDSAYFVDVTPKKQPIGIRAPNYPITRDGMSFGFSGNLVFKVMEDPTSIGNFLTKIVGQKKEVTPNFVSLWLRDGLLFQVFKELIGNYDYEEFRDLDKVELDMNLESKLGFELKDYGIEINSVEIKYYTPPKKM